MRLPARGYQPGLRSLSITRGLEPWSDKIQGYDVYRFTSAGGIRAV